MNKIFISIFIGALNLSTYSLVFAQENPWTRKNDMPTPRLGPISCVVDDIIYVIGGASDRSKPLNAVESYNPKTDIWTTGADMPTARAGMATCVVDNIIYAIGGGAGYDFLPVVEAYDPIKNIWIEKTSLPQQRLGPACDAVKGKIYVIGGAVP
jgi:N-acetylneuraminic acid mutarotase